MGSKRTKKLPKDLRAQVVDAALTCAASREWQNISLSDIAAEAGLTLGDLAGMFDGRDDILSAYAARVDADVLESYGQGGGVAERDAIFDILMERFDRLNQDRDAVLSIMGSFCADPKQVVIAMPGIGRSMTWMLEACGMETLGLKGAVRVAGLAAIYIYALRIWREDDSQDMAKTMAALDRALGRAQSLANTLGL